MTSENPYWTAFKLLLLVVPIPPIGVIYFISLFLRFSFLVNFILTLCGIPHSLYRYLRLVVNLFAVWTFKPIPPPENPTLTSQDATIIIPSLSGCGEELEETLRTILVNEPYQIILVTIDANRPKAEDMLKNMPASKTRIQLLSIPKPNKRRQMVRAIPEVKTEIMIFVDDDVSWPKTVLTWILAVFEKDPVYGGVATCQRLRRARAPFFSMQRAWDFLGALYLERRNFDCARRVSLAGPSRTEPKSYKTRTSSTDSHMRSGGSDGTSSMPTTTIS
jgi:uncharacterized membrane protein YqaE (UPF0057 family)